MIQPDIWSFSSKALMSWMAAYAVWEPISYKVFPALFKAATTQEYYNPRKFSFGVVAAGDFLYSTLILLVAQQVIAYVFKSEGAKDMFEWAKRLLVFLGVQWVSDLSFYGFVKSLPDAWTPRYLDFFKRYGAQVGLGAPIGDSLYGIVWLSLTQWMATHVPDWIQLFLIVAFLFMTLVVPF